MSAPIVMPDPAGVTHVRDEGERTFCGRIIVAGVKLHEAGADDVNCVQCVRAMQAARARDSRRQTDTLLMTLRLAKLAYDIWSAWMGGVPFERLDERQTHAWIEVAQVLRWRFEKQIDDTPEKSE